MNEKECKVYCMKQMENIVDDKSAVEILDHCETYCRNKGITGEKFKALWKSAVKARAFSKGVLIKMVY